MSCSTKKATVFIDDEVKAYFLGYMINKLLNCILGRTKPDDRDSFVNKRIDLPGDLIFELFKQQIGRAHV
jgi:DNA-directed RNA polymerase II subunit RPB2